MSVVAVKVYEDKISIAADSIMCQGWSKKSDGNFNKLIMVNDMIIGSVGYIQEGSLMFHYAETHKPSGNKEKDVLSFIVEFVRWKNDLIGSAVIDNSYIIVYMGKAFYVEKLLVYEIKNYDAIGVGMDFANAALYLGHEPEEAVKVACDLCCMVSEPILKYEVAR